MFLKQSVPCSQLHSSMAIITLSHNPQYPHATAQISTLTWIQAFVVDAVKTNVPTLPTSLEIHLIMRVKDNHIPSLNRRHFPKSPTFIACNVSRYLIINGSIYKRDVLSCTVISQLNKLFSPRSVL